MKHILTRLFLLLLLAVGLQTGTLQAQTPSSENQVVFLRPGRGMGQGIEHVLFLNGKEVGRLTNSSMLTYTVKTEGEYDLLVKMLLGGAAAGTPFATKVQVKPGEPVYVNLKVAYAHIAELVDADRGAQMESRCSYKTTGKDE